MNLRVLWAFLDEDLIALIDEKFNFYSTQTLLSAPAKLTELDIKRIMRTKL